MNRWTRAASTGFQVLPSRLKCVPMTQPSATWKISATLSMLTPVLAKTGVSGSRFLTRSRSEASTGWPVIGPDTQMTSASDDQVRFRAVTDAIDALEQHLPGRDLLATKTDLSDTELRLHK